MSYAPKTLLACTTFTDFRDPLKAAFSSYSAQMIAQPNIITLLRQKWVEGLFVLSTHSGIAYFRILATTPAPTVRPPSR
ncbi:hypothetical protein, partial [Achromobacter marplatensis]|uniref:hypothetical protein n=1 Tax=Achromobacter marplatensis TaxID=470868 RepID=UPI0028E4ED58